MSKKLILTINVRTYAAEVLESHSTKVVMIPFDGEAISEYFAGKTVCQGFDTQITKDGIFSLSARYMLEGTDRNGKRCRLFIENNGTSMDNCKPTIYTDSSALSFLESAKLSSVAECAEDGVIIRIYMEMP
ncbi:MAG: hypothetical protein HDR21_05515 [Lachnospiraceae bacterium]|nr:hypothetical protein [Lachnospiraceae bacterium]